VKFGVYVEFDGDWPWQHGSRHSCECWFLLVCHLLSVCPIDYIVHSSSLQITDPCHYASPSPETLPLSLDSLALSPSSCFVLYLISHTTDISYFLPLSPSITLYCWLVAGLSGRTSVFGRRTFSVLRSTCSWRVTTYVGKPSAMGQPTRPTQPFIPSGSIDK